jgi:MFS family permease
MMNPSRFTLTYGTGLLSMGLMDAMIFIVPIWAIHLGANATEVGILVGARSVLPSLFAIHGGVLMDRFGIRRVMIVLVTVTGLTAPLYSALPWFGALVVLQLLIGLTTSVLWVGAQALIAQALIDQTYAEKTEYMGRFSFAGRIGTFVAPVLMGVLWDVTTPMITFSVVSLWAAALLACVVAIPDPAPILLSRHKPKLRELAPKLKDYGATFALVALPAIAITIAAGFLRNSTSSIQGSIYVLYLDGIGMTGTAIGILFAAVEAGSGIGSLLAGRVAQRFGGYSLMVGATAIAIVLINITPILGGLFVVLIVVQALRGIIQGINQPVMFAIQSQAVGPDRQGAAIALRVTVNRISAVVIPPIMGVIADAAGIEESFYILGGTLLVLICSLGLVARTNAFKAKDRSVGPL